MERTGSEIRPAEKIRLEIGFQSAARCQLSSDSESWTFVRGRRRREKPEKERTSV